MACSSTSSGVLPVTSDTNGSVPESRTKRSRPYWSTRDTCQSRRADHSVLNAALLGGTRSAIERECKLTEAQHFGVRATRLNLPESPGRQLRKGPDPRRG